MITKSLSKLIDEAILPAFALIFGEMFGLFLVIYFLKMPITLVNGQIFKVLPSVHFTNLADYVIAENYSNLAMFSIAALGTIIVLVRAHFFHESHIHPTLHAKSGPAPKL